MVLIIICMDPKSVPDTIILGDFSNPLPLSEVFGSYTPIFIVVTSLTAILCHLLPNLIFQEVYFA